MNKVIKRINLEDARNRMSSCWIPYYTCDEYGNIVTGNTDSWGNFTSDIVFNKPKFFNEQIISSYVLLLEHIIPVEHKDRATVTFRFKNLMNFYYWLVNVFIPSCKYYEYCYRGIRVNETVVSPFENINGTTYIDYDPTQMNISGITEVFEIGEQICYITMLEDFINKFKRKDTSEEQDIKDVLKNAMYFLFFMEVLLNKQENTYNVKNKKGKYLELTNSIKSFISPYLCVDFYLDNKINDIGVYTPYFKEWVKNRKYYLGDTVLYQGINFRLTYCTEYDLIKVNPMFYPSIKKHSDKKAKTKTYYTIYKNKNKIPKSFHYYDESVAIGAFSNIFYLETKNENGVYEYYEIKPYYCGYYDEKQKETFFDELNKQIANSEQTSINIGVLNGDGRISSKNTFKTIIQTHWTNITTQETNNKLYGKNYISDSKLSNLIRFKRSFDDTGNNLPFIINDSFIPKNKKKLPIKPIKTELQYILWETNHVDKDGIKYYDKMNHINFYENEDSLVSKYSFPTKEGVTAITTNDVVGCSVIEFDYSISVGKQPNNGINYKEKYKFSIETREIKYSGNELTFKYFDIDTSHSLNNCVINDDIIASGKYPIFSNVTYLDKNTVIDKTSANLFKIEALNDIVDIGKNVDVEIGRGISACFERHSILGEVKTFQDLENYRNQFFSKELQQDV